MIYIFPEEAFTNESQGMHGLLKLLFESCISFHCKGMELIREGHICPGVKKSNNFHLSPGQEHQNFYLSCYQITCPCQGQIDYQ